MTQESAVEMLKGFAIEHVNNMTPEVVQDLSPWARLEVILHTGTDQFGKRFKPEEMRILRRTRDTLFRKLIGIYGGGDIISFNKFAYEQRLDIHTVREELARRAEEPST